MLESKYQSNIITECKKDGGKLVNGVFSKSGEADLQGGYPFKDQLMYIAIEVKTEKDYNRIMSAISIINTDKKVQIYKVNNMKKLKKQEYKQILKINEVRLLGGLALIAFNYKQVKDYAEGVLNDC